MVQIKLTIKYNLSTDFDNLQHSAEIIFAFGEYSNKICTKKMSFFINQKRKEKRKKNDTF